MSDVNVTFDHVHIMSEDPESAAAWYANILGGEPARLSKSVEPLRLVLSSMVLLSLFADREQASNLTGQMIWSLSLIL